VTAGQRVAADSHDVIEVRGASENNLANISLDIPKRRLTVFTGVSGSGKSSLVFGTIAAESQRLINETYTAFIQSFMPSLGRPDVDALHNLSAAILVDQERMGANARSTVGTATDASTMLRIIFSRLGSPHVGTSTAFSFNTPEGMCPECEGLGRVSEIDVDQLVDVDRSLNEGAITVPQFTVGTWYWQTLAHSGFVDPDVKHVSVGPLVATLRDTLDSMVEVGLGYLSLDRESGTLSGGEAQRVKMVRHLGSALTDVTYVFDEPTVGLHPHDVQRMNDLLLRLRDKGNTVLVVEHEPEVIEVADHVVDLGPGAGSSGGRVCFTGDVAGLRGSGTLTGRYLDHRARLRDRVRRPRGQLSITGATLHNLKDVSVDLPLGVLTVVTGVAGSGKSSLIHGSLSGREDVIVADQSPIRGSRRSNPATYTGLLDPIRAAFAKANGVKAALFSANSEGACPNCKGIGLVYTDLAMMAGVASVCELCQGKRFTPEVLTHKLRGKDISEVLGMSVAEARDFFTSGPARAILDRLADVGLAYLGLGQPLTTLSGGERQRVKLAIHMANRATTYVLDEPTSGLHLADVDQLLALLDRLVDDGNTVIIIEHHQAVMAHADWLVDLGPGAGQDGGRVVFAGTPAELVADGDSLTARHLRVYLQGSGPVVDDGLAPSGGYGRLGSRAPQVPHP
jgi:excinuclease UvrABC ATPase subunit